MGLNPFDRTIVLKFLSCPTVEAVLLGEAKWGYRQSLDT